MVEENQIKNTRNMGLIRERPASSAAFFKKNDTNFGSMKHSQSFGHRGPILTSKHSGGQLNYSNSVVPTNRKLEIDGSNTS